MVFEVRSCWFSSSFTFKWQAVSPSLFPAPERDEWIFCRALTFHLDEFQAGALVASPLRAAETQHCLLWLVSSVCMKPLCLFPAGGNSASFLGQDGPPTSLAQLCCPFGIWMALLHSFQCWYRVVPIFVFPGFFPPRRSKSNLFHILAKVLKGIFFKVFIYLFIYFREGGREGEREGQQHQCI